MPLPLPAQDIVTLKRFLFLDDEPLAGQPGGGDRFTLPSEFWLQLGLLLHGRSGVWLTDFVSAEQAAALAGAIEDVGSDESWQLHLSLWGDDEGLAVKSLIEFLQASGFAVVRS